MKKAIVMTLLGAEGFASPEVTPALLGSEVDTDVNTMGYSQRPKLTTAEKRAAYIYPKVIKALNNATRGEILAFLLENEGRQIPFTRLKEQIPRLKNASLSRHLNILQRAWVIERRVEFGSPRTAEDPYYCFYSISRFGEELLEKFGEVFTQSVKAIPC